MVFIMLRLPGKFFIKNDVKNMWKATMPNEFDGSPLKPDWNVRGSFWNHRKEENLFVFIFGLLITWYFNGGFSTHFSSSASKPMLFTERKLLPLPLRVMLSRFRCSAVSYLKVLHFFLSFINIWTSWETKLSSWCAHYGESATRNGK